jgi:hypothetical protein
MKRLIFAAALAAAAAISFGSATPASAQTDQGTGAIPGGLCSALTPGYPTACAPTIGDQPFYAAVTTTLTQFIAAPTSPASIRITFLQFEGLESATGGNMLLEQGTGTNCGTNTAVVSNLAYMTASTYVSGSYGWAEGAVFILKPGSAACVAASAGSITSASISGTAAIW